MGGMFFRMNKKSFKNRDVKNTLREESWNKIILWKQFGLYAVRGCYYTSFMYSV